MRRRRTNRTAQRREAQAIKRETKRQRSVAMRTRYLQSIKTPFQYEGKLSDNSGYYAATKKGLTTLMKMGFDVSNFYYFEP